MLHAIIHVIQNAKRIYQNNKQTISHTAMGLTKAQCITLLFGLHPRCGASSRICLLDTCTLRLICGKPRSRKRKTKKIAQKDYAFYTRPSWLSMLAARGPQDVYLSGSDTITYFKTTYQRARFSSQRQSDAWTKENNKQQLKFRNSCKFASKYR